MSNLLEPVQLPEEARKLVCDFMLIFSRFEYALKKCDYVFKLGKNGIGIDRKRFAEEVQTALAELFAKQANRELVQLLLERPPMEEVLEGKKVAWIAASSFSGAQVDANFLLDAIYRVRNNLFHGGKWPPEPVRDEPLLKAATAAVRFLVELHPDVKKAYYSVKKVH